MCLDALVSYDMRYYRMPAMFLIIPYPCQQFLFSANTSQGLAFSHFCDKQGPP